MDLEDTFCQQFDDWETSEERQHETDELLRLVCADLLVELPVDKLLKVMAPLLMRKRFLLAEELVWD